MSQGRAAGAFPLEPRRRVVDYYERSLARYGPTAQGMDWKDEASQALRFEVLCGLCDLDEKTVHEVGAGAGHLSDYLLENDIRAIYSGSDLSAEMIEQARRLHPDVSFDQRDALAVSGAGPYDVVLCSGLFHVKLETAESEWRDFVEAAIRSMYDACRVGIAFNLMSDRVDYREGDLYYASPDDMLAFCLREFGRRVVLRHDYPLYEYTVYVYRDAER